MKRFTPLIAAVFPLLFTAAALACPFCKDSIPSSDAQSSASVPGGFNNSIYLMLGGFVVTMTRLQAARPPQQPRGVPVGTGSFSAPRDHTND